MKKKYLLGLLFLLVVSCDKTDDVFRPISVKALNTVSKPVNQQTENEIDDRYIGNLIDFSSKFAYQTFKEESTVFSPLSIYNCYAMLYEGTTNNVRSEMNELFNYEYLDLLKNPIKTAMEMLSIDDEKTKLDTANSFWVSDQYQDKISENYLDTLAEYYYAEAFGGNLSLEKSRQDMANWINKKTNDFFKVTKDNFETDEQTALVLINTLYAKSPWLNEFNKENNYTDKFYSFAGTDSKTFMTNRDIGLIYSGEDFDVASIPLHETGLEFRILLPHEDKDSIEILKNNVNNIFDIYLLPRQTYKITYKIPQFNVKTKYDLKEELQQIGLKKPFEKTNDYENLFNSKVEEQAFFVSQSIHEAGIDVNNDGIEAAAYTTIIVSEDSAPAPIDYPPFEFNANRPFLYALTYKNIPLFLGTLVD